MNQGAISDLISSAMREKNFTNYKKLQGSLSSYIVKIDKYGRPIKAIYILAIPNNSYFDNLIKKFLLQLKYSPAYELKGKVKKFFPWSVGIDIQVK